MNASSPRNLFIALFSILVGCQPSFENESGVSLELAQYRKQVISELAYSLTLFVPEDENKTIPATLATTFTLAKNKVDLPMDFRENPDRLLSLRVNGNEAQMRWENEHLILPKKMLTVGQNIVEVIFTAGETSLNRNPDYLYTLFVPDRARTAFPLFDQPDLKAEFKLQLEIPSHWNAISNGPMVSQVEHDSTKTWQFAATKPISSYLFSFVAGDFETITRTIDGREMTLLHRETDQEKVDQNLDDIFQLHAFSLNWMEEYTGIGYPFQKFDFALIPAFQYGGMEHVGAIQYRASSLFLDESPSQSQLLSRASLIAHETAHMWFGDLVTMEWFNDVWTKEVFANFMAAKIMNPRFPEINHELNFLVRHYPSAYSVDRTEGANPIRQELPNLNEAGTMYGAIIYNKAPIMMRQLEHLVGKDKFRDGMQEYLNTFAFNNATWLDLIHILDQKTENDLLKWSEVWVNTAGRPEFSIGKGLVSTLEISQSDPNQMSRIWPQFFELQLWAENEVQSHGVISDLAQVLLPVSVAPDFVYPNSNGFGYGLFPQSVGDLRYWKQLDVVARGSALINLYENMLDGKVEAAAYYNELVDFIPDEENQLILNLALDHLRTIYWKLFDDAERRDTAQELEAMLWQAMLDQEEASRRKIFFNSWENVVLTSEELDRLYRIWDESYTVDNLPLSENDFIGMAGTLALKDPAIALGVISTQLGNIQNTDRRRRFEFIAPALSPDQSVRDAFFESLGEELNRQTESWVLGALAYLHHPLRVEVSEKYLLPSLELLEEIQITGDIFFPGRWMSATLGNYHSDTAVETVRTFLADRPLYNYQLRLKILQAADMMFRVNEIWKGE